MPVLSRSLRVITFDNRGVGRSRARIPSYTTEAMADDAVSVLDAAGVERAHVYGFSLGGMVAQQLALRHPERVRSIVLGATHAGGPRAARPGDDVIAFFRRRASMTAEDAARASVPFNYGATLPARARRPHRRGHPAPARAPVPRAGVSGADRRRDAAQLLPAAEAHRGAGARRPRPRGPRDSGRQRRDPRRADSARAELRILDDAGHLYATEQPGRRRRGRAVLPGGAMIDGARRARGRRHPPPRGAAPARGGASPRRARADLRRARRALEPPRAGAAGARRRRRDARRLPRPLGARGRRAAVRGEQGRRRARAAQLAAGAAGAGRGAGRRAGAAADRRARRTGEVAEGLVERLSPAPAW